MRVLRTNKFLYYLKGIWRQKIPAKNAESRILSLRKKLSYSEIDAAEKRAAYYCKITGNAKITGKTKVSDLKNPVTPKAYYFDTYEFARFFNPDLPIDYLFGDVTTVPPTPSIVKSRPICGSNQNSVLMNLDKARHFVFIKDDKDFLDKKNMLVGRGAVYQSHRCDFYEKYFENPLCDLGQVNDKGGNPAWIKPRMPISEHLNYKFILSLQGNDVATNLKWIMSSNSLAVMPKPTLETWFMEGRLLGGEHYIEIKPDYSDLEEQLKFYISRPDLCQKIIDNAHRHCAQFFNKNAEDLCSLLVLKKYFKSTLEA